MSSRDSKNMREPVRLQSQSSGVISDTYQGQWVECVYSEDGIVNKEERYIFRCSADKACCGRECCIPVAAGIPLWLLILLLVLLFLLVLFVLALIIYYCCTYCRRKRIVENDAKMHQQPVGTIVTTTSSAQPRVEVYRKPLLADQYYNAKGKSPSNSIEGGGQRKRKSQKGKAATKKRDVVTVLTDLESSVDTQLEPEPSTEPLSSDHDLDTLPPSQPSTVNEKRMDSKTRRILSEQHQKPAKSQHHQNQHHDKSSSSIRPKILPFEPSPMEETFEKPARPIPISYHEESEISIEKRPLLNFLQKPEEHKAQMMYYRSGSGQVPSYNDVRPNY